MKVYDIAIIGSGMGGSMIASKLAHKDIIVFEKDANLGGCAGTFQKRGRFYNAGATTFAGFEEGNFIQEVFKDKRIDIKKSSTAFRVIQQGKTIDRKRDFESFLEEIEKVYPNTNNRLFWQTLYDIDRKFWQIKDIYYAKDSLISYIKTMQTCLKLLKNFKLDLFKSGERFIKDTLGDISQEYQEFIDAGLLITVQTTAKDIPLLALALGLCYPFHDVYYVVGGMGRLFEALLENIHVKTNEKVLEVNKNGKCFSISTKKDTYFAKKVILNSTVYDSGLLFKDEEMGSYFDKFSFSDQGAFVLYMYIQTKEDLLHHYQVILDEFIPNSISKSFFVSISDKDDKILSKDGLSITISTHTKPSFWSNLPKEEYEKKKQITQEFIKKEFLKHFNTIKSNDIVDIFSATPKTFAKFVQRENCGGKAMSFSNMLQIPTCKTSTKDIFQVGDTTFAGQGWPGVGLGVKVLLEKL